MESALFFQSLKKCLAESNNCRYCLICKTKLGNICLIYKTGAIIFDSATGKIDILPFVKKELMEEFHRTDLQVIEQPPGTDSFTGGWLDNPEVMTYSD